MDIHKGAKMADVSMNDFLLQYYMQMHFNKMPPEVRAQFESYLKADDFRGNMKTWRDKLMHRNADGKYVQNDLPDPDDANGNYHLTDEEWKKLFNAFQTAFRGMAADKKSFKDNSKANDFLNEYFGDATHLFSNAMANDAARQQIDGPFKDFLESNRQSLEIYLKQWGLVDSSFSYGDLISGIKSRKYDSEPDFQNKIKTIAQYITFYARQSDFQQALGLKQSNIPDFTDIENGFEGSSINPQKLDYFKRNYRSLLNTLHNDSKVYEVFRNYDKGKISKPLDEALSKVDYADKTKDDYVPPKRTDELTLWQQLTQYIGDTWSDYMDKYIKLRGDRVYFSPSAKSIISALDGAKYKPTDGLAKVLENAGKIKENLQYKSPTATKHFDWFVKTMSEMQSTMKKAFAGALQNGRQMQALVSEMIMKAVREGKMDEAKTAMEVLSVIKYGYTTSKIMDTLAKENLSIFSDKGLSWNKNEGVKFVTTALDKSIKTAFMGIGYGITAAGNAIKLSGSKFNGNPNRMTGARDQWTASNNAARQNTEQMLSTNRGQQANIQTNLANMRARGITEQALETSITQYRQNIATDQAQLEQEKQTLVQMITARPGHPDEQAVSEFLFQMENGANPQMPNLTDPQLITGVQNIMQRRKLRL